MSQLTITTRNVATGPILAITGDLDYDSAPRLRETVNKLTLTRGQVLTLDLAGLEYCDSSGLTVILTARNLATEQDADIALAAIPDNVARILSITGLDRVFTIHPGASTANAPRSAAS
ncbi:STAS domain-containing protein [Streptomyces sp. NPDC127036]|uniref:STAS domain-containing protein n=1 Tax=unclassified Streptomyces TaxID=2593676 RepID=UPI00364CC7D9